MSLKKGSRSNVKRLLIVGILIIISVILPIAIVILFLTSAKSMREEKVKRENITQIRNDVVDLSPHFIIDHKFISSQLCVTERLSSFKGVDIIENIPTVLTGEISDNHWQLCVAHHNHQHAFKLKVFSDQDDLNCELFLSASSISPSVDNWDWKTTNDIKIYSYAIEFQKSALDALFISVQGIGCKLELEVVTVSIEEILHKVSLRGGQRILPRDLDKMMEEHS